jgi:orotate phosphoribosyltransferase
MSDERRPAATAARVEQIFSASGAYRHGHFKLKSGRHGDRYLEKFQVLQWPEHVVEIGKLMAELVRTTAGGQPIDVVIGPTTGGVILAYEVGRQLGTRGIFAESVTDADGARRELRRGFRIGPGERVALVDDVVTTGASLLEMIPLIEAAGGEIASIVVIVDRSGQLHDLVSPATGRRYRAQALWSLDLPTYEPGAETCPGCAAGLPIEAPGSSGTSAGSSGTSAGSSGTSAGSSGAP